MHVSLTALCLGTVLALQGIAGGQIFADFETSMGPFTCELSHEAAPQAVANFIGLAEGSRPWIDLKSGGVETGKPFYNGVTFHRVIGGFMNQSGSRNGLGTDGPGYRFRDETANGLTHTGPGILSMANSGPNSNGAQFFVTVASANHLDGKHTVFGKVTAGMDVVNAINGVPKVAVDPPAQPSVPVTPIILNSVTIRRVGAAAEAFDIHAQDLPLCRAGSGRLRVERGSKAEFVFDEPQPAGSMVPVFRSPDLKSWVKLTERFQGTGASGPHTIKLDNAPLAKAFYQIPLVTYPDAMAPAGPGGVTLDLEWGNADAKETLKIAINEAGNGGTVEYSAYDGPRTITAVGYTPGANYDPDQWQAEWIIESSGGPPSLRPLGILTYYEAKTETHVSGTFDLYLWDFGWQYFTSGVFSHNR